MLQYGQRKMKGENLETTANGGNKMYYSSGNYEAFARPKTVSYTHLTLPTTSRV